MIGLVDSGGAREDKPALHAATRAVFEDGGPLASTLGLPHRPQQASMAEATAAALEGDTHLLFEAGTGVGKSLAYLIPGLMHAVDQRRPLIVSTHTISLQEQVRNKDLRLCERLFAETPGFERYAGFKTALMVGRGNYLCSTRLRQAMQEAGGKAQGELFDQRERDELNRIAQWAATSGDGLRQELSPAPLPEVWDAVNADATQCSRKNCPPDQCPYQRARSRLKSAHCVIVNHSLLFSLIHAGMAPSGEQRGILLPDDCVVLDEAHRIPGIATDHFGMAASNHAVDRALKRLYNPQRSRGFLARHGEAWDRAAVEEALQACGEFFDYIGQAFLRERNIQRVHEADFCENLTAGPLKNVAERLGALLQREDDERVRDELHDHRRRVAACRDAILSFIAMAEEDHVHWLERGGKKGQRVTLRTAPLDVAPCLRQTIFQRRTAAVLTSASLSDGRSIEPFQERVGAEAAEATIERSPFDFENNCRCRIATDCPAPDPSRGRLDLDYLSRMVAWLALREPGGSLVLFTSHADLRQVRDRTEEDFRRAGRPLFCQGHEHARSELTRRFAEAGNGVLFGTDSFWTGVDVPGPALSQVILTRLPFDNPSHPVTEARAEHIRSRGGDPFAEMTLPDALVKFRQGVGRLIRRHEDQGAIVILDSRILTKPYGRRFLDALPARGFQRFDETNRDSVFNERE